MDGVAKVDQTTMQQAWEDTKGGLDLLSVSDKEHIIEWERAALAQVMFAKSRVFA